MVGYSNELGNIHYSEEVLAKIVGLSTMECYGVVGMVSKNATEGLWELMRIENLSKGVKLKFDNSILSVVILVLEYGTKISEIENNIIQKVRYSVENFTGLKVSSVTVNVQAVRV